MSSSFNWLTASFSWIRRGRKAHFQPKAPRFRPVIENLEGRLNPAPVASLPQLLDIPHSLVVLSPDIASQVPVAEYAGARVVTLDPTRDAISQISASLAGQSAVTSLRVIGHGQPGSLSLAGQTINLATLQARSVEVAGWASHLTPDADILLYGCSVASTGGGRAFVNTLATLTGADVAASTDPTGAGGNLTLEYTAGVVTDHLQASSQAWTKSGLQLPSEGDYNYDTNPDGTSVTITGYTGPGGAVTIPGTLGGLPVTAIGNYAFYNESSLTSVTIPESVTSIGDLVFNNCSSLTAIEVAVTSNDFSSVDGVLFNKAQTTLIQCPGGKAGTYTIPESVTFIRNRALSACFSLTSIEVAVNSNDFSSIDGVLFNKTQTTLIQCPGGKSGSYTIPESATVIGDDSFALCDRLTSVTIPNSVISIGSDAFALCTSLTSMTIPEGVTSIGDGAFFLCSGLTSVTILPGVTTIGDSAFGYCGGLTSMTIPEGVTSIGNYAFGSCVSLTRVTIFPGVTTIGDSAFGYCWGLTRINTLGNAPALVGSEAFYQVPATLYYTSGTLGWTNPWEGLPTVEMTGGDYQFSINPDSTSVTITGYTGPGGVVTIPGTLADLPVTAIGKSAFEGITNLTNVTIPASVTSIGERTFASCTSLTGVTIPEGVTSIGKDAFVWCSSLTSVTIPASVTSIGVGVFYSCSSLTSVTILSGVTTIEAWSFASCSSLTTSFTIPSSVTTIGYSAFAECTSLTSVTIPESVTFIEDGAFSDCTSLARINTLGNAPSLGGSNVFYQVPATLYYTSGTTGWTNPWGGLPTVESSPVAAPFSLAAGSLVASLGDGKIGILSATGNYQEIYPFPGYEGPLNVNTVNSAAGQNADTIVVAVAGRSLPHVLTIDSSTGFVTSSFYAFDPGFLGGVTVAGGVTRIGGEITVSPEGVVTRIGGVITSVILCGAGSGSSPSVSVFNATTSAAMGAFYAYSNQYLGGVRVALSEAGADGTSFAIIGSTINSHVVWFDLNDYYNPILSFNTFPDILTPNGVYVASGDLDDDGLNEIVVGAGQGTTSPQVAVFDFVGRLKKSFNAFDLSFLGGVQVGVADFNKDGKLDILAASGVGVPGTLNVFNYDNLALLDSVFISDSTLGFDVASNFSRG